MKAKLIVGLALLAAANAVWAVWWWAGEPIPPLPPTEIVCWHLGPSAEGPVLGGVPWEQQWHAR